MEHPSEDYQMSPYQLKQQTSDMYSQDDLTGQQSNNPYTMGSYGNYGMPGINPSIMMGSRQGDLTRINEGNMVSHNYSPSMSSNADTSPHAHAVLQKRALNSQEQRVVDLMLQMASSYPSNQVKLRCDLCGLEGDDSAHVCLKFTCQNCSALEEKEIMKQTLATEEKELGGAGSDLQALLDEKKEELMKEGENLSNQQLQSSTSIKILRAKEKENETTIAAQKKKLDEQTKELERLITVLDSKEEMQEKQAEAVYQLRKTVQRQEKELIMHKSDLEDAQEKIRSLQTALDNSYKEKAELYCSNTSLYSKAQGAALCAETHVRKVLEAAMEREQQRLRQQREAFIMQIDDLKLEIDDLRLEMACLKKGQSQREDLLRQEIAHLQERLQQDAARSQDLTHSETSAMQPLLRQIENLQATLGVQSVGWQRMEKNLTDRLAQIALAMAQEKERTANDHLMELSARVASLEVANKQEKTQLAAEVESDRSELEELQDIGNSAVAHLESRLNEEVTQLKMDKDLEKPARKFIILFKK